MNKTINTGLALGIIIILAGIMGGAAWRNASRQDLGQNVVQSGKNRVPKDTKDTNKGVPISELFNNPTDYINKTIQIEGIVQNEKGNCGCYLEEGNAKIKVECWANRSFSPGTCPPNAKKCDQPSPMDRFSNKPVRLTGVFKEEQNSALINDSCAANGKYFITDVKDATIVDNAKASNKKDATLKICHWEPGQCEALINEGYYFNNVSGTCELWPAKKSGCTSPPFKSLNECDDACSN